MTQIDHTAIERFDITVGGLTFQARQAGPADGRPVLLLHGVPQSSACWNFQLPALAAAGYRAVAFTQRGYSPGARMPEVSDYSMDKLCQDALGVAAALGFDRFDLVGHDAGAGVAWSLASFHAEHINTLTAVSVPHLGAFAASYQAKGAGDDDQHARSSYMRSITGQPRGAVEAMFTANDNQVLRAMLHGLPEESVAEYVDLVGSPEKMQGVLDWYRATRLMGTPKGSDGSGLGAGTSGLEFPKVEVPTMFVWSDQDPAIGRRPAEATADWVSGPYQFEVIEGVGHWIQETVPDRFNELLLGHLAAHPPA